MHQLIQNSPGQLTFVGDLTVEEVEQAQRSLLARLETTEALAELDLSEVAALDGAGIQLLIALKLRLPELRIHSCPDNHRTHIDFSGLLPFIF